MTRTRPGHPGDLPALAAARAALAEPAPGLLPAMLEREGPGFALVAVAPDPVGYLLALPGPEAVYVPELAVRPGCQRQGHGSALLSALVERADQGLRLTVAAADEGARRFYEEHGFELAERVTDRFESGDGLVLVRPVSRG